MALVGFWKGGRPLPGCGGGQMGEKREWRKGRFGRGHE